MGIQPFPRLDLPSEAAQLCVARAIGLRSPLCALPFLGRNRLIQHTAQSVTVGAADTRDEC